MPPRTKQKRIRQNGAQNRKAISVPSGSTEGMLQTWYFDMADNDGCFCFDPQCMSDAQCKHVLVKIVHYSRKTWADIRQETHDRNNKSKHHFLDYEALSIEAKARFIAKRFDDAGLHDAIFSMSFSNKMRVIGIRKDHEFHAVWFDPEHRFCPSTR